VDRRGEFLSGTIGGLDVLAMMKRRIQFASRWMKIYIFCIAAAAGCVAAAPEQAKAKPCSTPEYHQFDFWIGDWDAFDVDNPSTVVARTRVDLILEGCVLREDYQGMDGFKGQSFTIYDNRRNVWHQTWVKNHGELLEIEGQFANGEMEAVRTNKVRWFAAPGNPSLQGLGKLA
jgi:hypothetical protein